MSSDTPDIRLSGVSKRYGDVVAVASLDLEIEHGEFFTLLGPSGSGKTTTLRMIAGFEEPDTGTVELAGKDVTALAPYDREVNTVFQDYALVPAHDGRRERRVRDAGAARRRRGANAPSRGRARDGQR